MYNVTNTAVCYMEVVRVNPKRSHHNKKCILKKILIVYLCEMMDIQQIYCGKPFVMYVS